MEEFLEHCLYPAYNITTYTRYKKDNNPRCFSTSSWTHNGVHTGFEQATETRKNYT